MAVHPGVELWLPTKAEEAEVYQPAEEERRAASPVMQVQRRVVENARHPERRLTDGKWTESASDMFLPRG